MTSSQPECRPEGPGSPSASAGSSLAAAVIDGVDVDAVAAAVRACPAVSDLFAGRLEEVGSYLPGRRVAGVVVDAQSLMVQIRSRWGIPVAEVLRQVAAAVQHLQHGHELRVVVADIDDPDDETSTAAVDVAGRSHNGGIVELPASSPRE